MGQRVCSCFEQATHAPGAHKSPTHPTAAATPSLLLFPPARPLQLYVSEWWIRTRFCVVACLVLPCFPSSPFAVQRALSATSFASLRLLLLCFPSPNLLFCAQLHIFLLFYRCDCKFFFLIFFAFVCHFSVVIYASFLCASHVFCDFFRNSPFSLPLSTSL